MKKNSGSIRHSGAYTSPGTPDYGNMNFGGIPKSWSSERVPLPTRTHNISSRRHVSAAALMPFNSVRTLPSKWDDAERWITSPVSGHSSVRTTINQPQRRQKSKSGPLGSAGSVGGGVRNFMENSLLTTGVLVPDGMLIRYDAAIAAKSGSLYGENSLLWRTNVIGLSNLVSETSLRSSSQDDKHGYMEDEESLDSEVVGHKDAATQVSAEESTHSSSTGRLSFSTVTSLFPTQGNSVSKDEVRDVRVDKGAAAVKKRELEKMKNTDFVESLSLPSKASEALKNTSKLQREESKITAWENLQKAKAEESIRKLEMKLEKKRSASMEKILNKLRATEMKADTMRKSLSENHSPDAHRRGVWCCIRVFDLSL